MKNQIQISEGIKGDLGITCRHLFSDNFYIETADWENSEDAEMARNILETILNVLTHQYQQIFIEDQDFKYTLIDNVIKEVTEVQENEAIQITHLFYKNVGEMLSGLLTKKNNIKKKLTINF